MRPKIHKPLKLMQYCTNLQWADAVCFMLKCAVGITYMINTNGSMTEQVGHLTEWSFSSSLNSTQTTDVFQHILSQTNVSDSYCSSLSTYQRTELCVCCKTRCLASNSALRCVFWSRSFLIHFFRRSFSADNWWKKHNAEHYSVFQMGGC